MLCRFTTAFSLFALIGTFATAAEYRDDTKVTTKSAPTTSRTAVKLSTVDQQFWIDPVTGEVHTKPVKEPTKSSGGATLASPTDSPESDPEPEPQNLYDHFDPADGSKAMLNAYLLAQLSMTVYSDATSEPAFEEHLIERLEPQGIEEDNIDVIMNDDTGTEAAAFTFGDTLVIAFRGTSSEGTNNINPYVDATTDLNDDPWPIEINNKKFFVHLGFWDSVDSVYPWVLARALDAHASGKKVWLTGHSLGAARATLAAARLHYADEIPVDGLMTFGSPKVGDENFAAFCHDKGADDWSLQQVTTRFVVNGDPATTFPEKEQIGINFFTGWVYYQHIGRTITIFPFDNGGDFTIIPGETNFTPTAAQWIGFLTGAGHSEHMWYDDALLEEVREDDQFNAIEAMVMEHQAVAQ